MTVAHSFISLMFKRPWTRHTCQSFQKELFVFEVLVAKGGVDVGRLRVIVLVFGLSCPPVMLFPPHPPPNGEHGKSREATRDTWLCCSLQHTKVMVPYADSQAWYRVR